MSSLIKKPNGLWEKRITIDGKRISFYSRETTEKKAQREIDEKIYQHQHSKIVGEQFSKVAKDWYNSAENELAIQSRTSYYKAMTRAVEYFECPIKEITIKDVNQYLSKMAQQGFALKTIQNHRMVLGLIFKYAVTNDKVESNPVKESVLPKAPKGKRHAASVSDEQKILQSNDDYLMPYLCLLAGLRRGEAIALTWDDIDFDSNIIIINKSCAFDSSMPVIKSTKTDAGERIVPLCENLKQRLLSRQSKGYVLTGEELKTHYWYQQQWELFKAKYGVSCCLHELRHSFATNLLGIMDVKTTSAIIGHSDVSFTLNIYTDIRKKNIEKATELLNSIFLCTP